MGHVDNADRGRVGASSRRRAIGALGLCYWRLYWWFKYRGHRDGAPDKEIVQAWLNSAPGDPEPIYPVQWGPNDA